jgi:hypothetical protein
LFAALCFPLLERTRARPSTCLCFQNSKAVPSIAVKGFFFPLKKPCIR